MTPVGVFFCWQGGAERDFVNSTNLTLASKRLAAGILHTSGLLLMLGVSAPFAETAN